MIIGSIKASVSQALRPVIHKHSLQFYGFPNWQDKTRNILMFTHAVPDRGVSDLEVFNSHAAKLSKEDLDQLSAKGNRRRRRFWYCRGQASDADYQSSEERPLDVRQLTP
jgi:hypothetical protein